MIIMIIDDNENGGDLMMIVIVAFLKQGHNCAVLLDLDDGHDGHVDVDDTMILLVKTLKNHLMLFLFICNNWSCVQHHLGSRL